MAGHKDFVPKTNKKFDFETAKYFFIAKQWKWWFVKKGREEWNKIFMMRNRNLCVDIVDIVSLEHLISISDVKLFDFMILEFTEQNSDFRLIFTK